MQVNISCFEIRAQLLQESLFLCCSFILYLYNFLLDINICTCCRESLEGHARLQLRQREKVHFGFVLLRPIACSKIHRQIYLHVKLEKKKMINTRVIYIQTKYFR